MILEDKLTRSMERWAEIYMFNSLAGFFKYLRLVDLSMQQAHALTFLSPREKRLGVPYI